MRIAGKPGEPHPQNVDRGTEVDYLETGRVAYRGMAAVGAHYQVRPDLQQSLWSLRDHAGDPPVILDQAGYVGSHSELEGGIALRLFGQEVEKVPLRHEGNETAAGGQAGKIGQHNLRVAHLRRELPELLVRQFQQLLKEAKFVHDFEGGGMKGVAAEVAQEIGMLLEDYNLDSGAGEQKSQHHAGWTPARNTTIDPELLCQFASRVPL